MTAPEPPTEPAKKVGLATRLLDLGNSNKLIAVATLLTVVTGLSFVVNSVVSAFSDGDDYSNEVLIRAIEFVQSQATSGQEPRGVGADRSREAAESALETLGAEAERSGATPKERREIAAALRAFGRGDSKQAMRILGEIATAQEMRGNLDAAAQTWCERGHLRVFTAHSDALTDFERANDISASGIDSFSQRERARLLRYAHRTDEAVHALRRAAAAAEAEGDAYAKCIALSDLGIMKGTSWDNEPAFQAEAIAANLEVLELSRGLRADAAVLDDPAFITVVGKAAGAAGGGMEGLYRPSGRAQRTADSEAVLERLREDLAALPEAGASGLSLINRDFTVLWYTSMLAYTLEALGDTEELIAASYAEAMEHGWAVLESADYSILHRDCEAPFRAAGTFFLRTGSPESSVDAFEGLLELHRRFLELAPDSRQYLGMYAGSQIQLGEAELAAGDLEGGRRRILEGLESARQLEIREGGQLGIGSWELLHICASILQDVDEEFARSLIEEADEVAVRLRGEPYWPMILGAAPTEWQEARARLGFEPAK